MNNSTIAAVVILGFGLMCEVLRNKAAMKREEVFRKEMTRALAEALGEGKN